LSRTTNARFYKEKDGTYHCHLLREKGIRLILRHSENEDIGYYALEIVMTPMRLLFEDEYLKLVGMEDSKSIHSAFKKAFKLINKEFRSDRSNKMLVFKLDNLDSYSYKRVDFAVNIVTKHTKAYIKLIKRAKIPDGFQQYLIYKESSKRYEPTENSFYIYMKSKSKSKSSQPSITIVTIRECSWIAYLKVVCEIVSTKRYIPLIVKFHLLF
jgi:hypothetical protein